MSEMEGEGVKYVYMKRKCGEVFETISFCKKAALDCLLM